MATTPVFLPEKSQGQKSLASHSALGLKELTQLSNLTTASNNFNDQIALLMQRDTI